MYAHVTNGTVDSVGSPPYLVYENERWYDLRTLDPAVLASVGWFPVTESPKPADTASTTWDPVFTPAGQVVVQSWVERPKTAQEIADATVATNESAIRTNLLSDMTTYQAHISKQNSVLAADFTGNNIGAMLKEIYRGLRRLDRMALDKFDGTD